MLSTAFISRLRLRPAPYRARSVLAKWKTVSEARLHRRLPLTFAERNAPAPVVTSGKEIEVRVRDGIVNRLSMELRRGKSENSVEPFRSHPVSPLFQPAVQRAIHTHTHTHTHTSTNFERFLRFDEKINTFSYVLVMDECFFSINLLFDIIFYIVNIFFNILYYR